jgi:sulfoxide reductase heme-binding subunit YedZ
VNPQFFWYLGRSSGVVTFCLVTFSTCLGLCISTRLAGGFFQRPWIYELHKFAALLALGFLAVHIAVVIPDPWTNFHILNLLVPGTAPYRPFAIAAGVLAMYGAIAGTFSFYVRHLIGHGAWRAIHYTTFLTFGLILVHGTLTGTDSSQVWLALTYITGALLVFSLTMYRVMAEPPSTGGNRQKDVMFPPTVLSSRPHAPLAVNAPESSRERLPLPQPRA